MADLSRYEANRQLELVAEQLRCPEDPWCERCACAEGDDVCFPDEAVRELRAYAWARDQRAERLEDQIDDYVLWCPGERGHAAALRRLIVERREGLLHCLRCARKRSVDGDDGLCDECTAERMRSETA